MHLKNNKIIVYIITCFVVIITAFFLFSISNRNCDVISSSIVSQNFESIIVDAGHGGLDGGAVAADGTQEKFLNLRIAQKLKYILELNGYKVIMTRTNDNSIHDKEAKTIRQQKVSDIRNREKIIESNPNSIFISIHQNKFYDETVYGAQIFYSGNNILSQKLANNINNSVNSYIQKENHRQIKKSGSEIYLLYNSTIPCVMVECGFLSNSEDLKKIKSNDFQKQLAISIACGVIKYSKGQ